jgi:hypothetical protein
VTKRRRRRWRRSHGSVCASRAAVSFSVSREHSPGLSVSRACKAFALSGAKHAVPLLQVQAQIKTRLKILCRDVGQDARTSTYGVCYSSHDVTRCRTFCQVSLSGLSSAFLGAGANLQEGAEPAPSAGQQGVDWLTKSVRRRQQVGVGTLLMGEFGEKCTYLGGAKINI